ncbi:MAG: CbtB-domain containing protein [Pseudomonas sp.]|uniref:CbtB domain-containing protein n=1 Tax=Pseudomonas sp. TaxID=306 RepID=UPI002735F0C8|nr:CbtB-domain containing protein [Pseudomonas sp.]MDP3846721.1 CbtB-domain containing protein [Pseudomonas sp.]
MSTRTLSSATTLALPLSQRLILAVGSCLLGAALIFLAGFAPVDALHNAAHDTRHSAAFPCH